MSRAAFMLVVGRTDHFPTEAQWEELEDEIDALRMGNQLGATDLELLRTEAGQRAILVWRERHRLQRCPR
jgi:hypothetical protein